jgi:hypothetical protein
MVQTIYITHICLGGTEGVETRICHRKNNLVGRNIAYMLGVVQTEYFHLFILKGKILATKTFDKKNRIFSIYKQL